MLLGRIAIQNLGIDARLIQLPLIVDFSLLIGSRLVLDLQRIQLLRQLFLFLLRYRQPGASVLRRINGKPRMNAFIKTQYGKKYGKAGQKSIEKTQKTLSFPGLFLGGEGEIRRVNGGC